MTRTDFMMVLGNPNPYGGEDLKPEHLMVYYAENDFCRLHHIYAEEQYHGWEINDYYVFDDIMLVMAVDLFPDIPAIQRYATRIWGPDFRSAERLSTADLHGRLPELREEVYQVIRDIWSTTDVKIVALRLGTRKLSAEFSDDEEHDPLRTDFIEAMDRHGLINVEYCETTYARLWGSFSLERDPLTGRPIPHEYRGAVVSRNLSREQYQEKLRLQAANERRRGEIMDLLAPLTPEDTDVLIGSITADCFGQRVKALFRDSLTATGLTDDELRTRCRYSLEKNEKFLRHKAKWLHLTKAIPVRFLDILALSIEMIEDVCRAEWADHKRAVSTPHSIEFMAIGNDSFRLKQQVDSASALDLITECHSLFNEPCRFIIPGLREVLIENTGLITIIDNVPCFELGRNTLRFFPRISILQDQPREDINAFLEID